MKLRVAIDATCLHRRKTGNETYIRGLLRGLESVQDPSIDLQVITTNNYRGPRTSRFTWQEIKLGNFLSRNFCTIPRLVAESADLYHAVYWSRYWDDFPKILMIHDISFVSYPQGFRIGERFIYNSLVRRAADRARHILTVSDFSKKEICENWKIPPDKVTITYNGLDECFHPDSGSVSEWQHSQGPYILYVGNLHPRKNLVRLLEAFILLKKEKKIEARLKIVGQNAWLYDDIFAAVRTSRLEKYIDFTGYVDQGKLIEAYQRAALTVYPSLYEGFGFPVLESMACGTPVVTSRTTSIPEVAGQACELVDPSSTEEIAKGIWRVFSSPERRAELRRLGLIQASRFNWERTARETIAAYRRCIG